MPSTSFTGYETLPVCLPLCLCVCMCLAVCVCLCLCLCLQVAALTPLVHTLSHRLCWHVLSKRTTCTTLSRHPGSPSSCFASSSSSHSQVTLPTRGIQLCLCLCVCLCLSVCLCVCPYSCVPPYNNDAGSIFVAFSVFTFGRLLFPLVTF